MKHFIFFVFVAAILRYMWVHDHAWRCGLGQGVVSSPVCQPGWQFFLLPMCAVGCMAYWWLFVREQI